MISAVTAEGALPFKIKCSALTEKARPSLASTVECPDMKIPELQVGVPFRSLYLRGGLSSAELSTEGLPASPPVLGTMAGWAVPAPLTKLPSSS